MEKQQRARTPCAGKTNFNTFLKQICKIGVESDTYLLYVKGGNREQTLPTKSNPNPDLTDAGDAENR